MNSENVCITYTYFERERRKPSDVLQFIWDLAILSSVC